MDILLPYWLFPVGYTLCCLCLRSKRPCVLLLALLVAPHYRLCLVPQQTNKKHREIIGPISEKYRFVNC